MPRSLGTIRYNLVQLAQVRSLHLFVLFSFCALTSAQQNEPQSPDWKTILDWLPPVTQTLIVASQPFVISKQVEFGEKDSESSINLLRSFALGRVADFPTLYEALGGQRVSLSVAGVRRFRDFSGIGLGPFDGCAVIAFSQPFSKALDVMLREMPQIKEEGAAVFILSTVREGSRRAQPEDLSLFVTQLGPSVLAVATERESMHMLLNRRIHAASPRALPTGLPEWKYVDSTAPVWAVRHFRRTYDPTAKRLSALTGPLEELDDSDVVGLVHNARPPGTSQIVDYFSNNRRAIQVARRYWQWKEEGLPPPKVRLMSTGVVQVVVSTPSPDSNEVFTLLFLASLGFVIAM